MKRYDEHIAELRRQAERKISSRHKEISNLPPDQLPALIHELEVHQIELEMQNEELQRSHTELELARDRYADLFDFAPVGYLILDPKGAIVRANLVSSSLLGVPVAALEGKDIYKFFPNEQKDTLFRHLRQVFKQQTQQSCEAEMVMKTGSKFFVKIESIIQPHIDKEDSPHCLTLLTDITALKRAEADSRDAKEAAEEISKEKSHFLSATSHDLRQPLQAITIFNDILKNKLDNQDALDLVYKISESLNNMKELLNALLDVDQLETGAIKPTIREFPIDELLRRIDTTFRSLAEQKGVSLRIVKSSAILKSDAVLLGQILDNLVSNAIRYTKIGKVLVGCRRRGSNLRIDVWDTGVGIPEDKKGQIFNAFYQLGNEARNRKNGSGLGLAIAARSARLLQGDIELASWKRGSRFSIEIPLAGGSRD